MQVNSPSSLSPAGRRVRRCHLPQFPRLEFSHFRAPHDLVPAWGGGLVGAGAQGPSGPAAVSYTRLCTRHQGHRLPRAPHGHFCHGFWRPRAPWQPFWEAGCAPTAGTLPVIQPLFLPSLWFSSSPCSFPSLRRFWGKSTSSLSTPLCHSLCLSVTQLRAAGLLAVL